MSKNYLFAAALFFSIGVAFAFIFSQPTTEKQQLESKFNKEFEAFSFDFPVGKPDGKGYYNAQKFGENNHLGDDWNGVGGGNTDYGDSIFSIANGQVIFAKDVQGGWGKVIKIKHLYQGEFYESLYAHCSKITIEKGDWIKKGTYIGNIGDCDGKYKAHLHFEIRDSLNMPIGGGYSSNNKGYVSPEQFISKN